MASYTRRQDSSSSDDDFTSPISKITEMHYHIDCGYKKFKLQSQGRDVYVHIRSCFCGHYTSFNIRGGVKNLSPEEGKEVHWLEECKWKKTKKGHGWEHTKKCLETRPRTASYTGNYAQTFPRYHNSFQYQ